MMRDPSITKTDAFQSDFPFWSGSTEALLTVLESRPTGLTGADARERLARMGPNQVQTHTQATALKLLASQFRSPIILLLAGAAALSVALGETTDGLIILGILLASGGLSFWQEYRAAGAVKELLSLIRTRATLLRDGAEVEVPIEEVVPGDVAPLNLDPANYGIAGEGLHQMVVRDFEGASFEVGPAGAQVDIRFEDLEGREIIIFVRETDTRPRRPFNLLAPMGVAASDPPALPLVYVNDFYFVRKAGTESRIEIDGRIHHTDPIPLVLDGRRVHFLRYSAAPFIVMLNPRTVTDAAILNDGATETDEIRYDLASRGDKREIRRMVRTHGQREVAIDFEPAFPHLLALREDVDVSGRFRITTLPPAGTVAGTWRVVRGGRQIDL